jgi:hypothetical protein
MRARQARTHARARGSTHRRRHTHVRQHAHAIHARARAHARAQDGRLVRVDIRVSGGPGGRCDRAVEQLGRPSHMPLHTVTALGDEAVLRSGRSSGSYEEEGAAGGSEGASGSGGGVPAWARSQAPVGGGDGGSDAAEAGGADGSDGGGAGAQLECLAAAAGIGVWALPSAASGSGVLRAMLPLLPPPRDSRATCESLAVDHASASVAVSWRPARAAATPAGGSSAHAHHAHIDVLQLWALPPSASGSTAGDPGSLFRVERTLTGHCSGDVLTRAAFVPSSAHLQRGAGGRPGPGWFASADEGRRAPALWDLGSGALVQTLEPHADHVTQLAAGSSSSLGSLLAACSATKVSLHRLVHRV